MHKIMMAALAGVATMVAGAGAAFADQAPVYMPECDADAQCEAGQICLWGGCYTPEACATNADCWTGWCGADGLCAEPPSCESDAECGAGNICDWGTCGPRGRTCLSDAECGDLAHCVFDNYTTVDTGTTDPDSAGSGSGSSGSGSASSEPSGSSSDDDAGAPYPEDPEDEASRPDPSYAARGECRIDVEAVSEVADCRAMCEAAAACATTSGGMEPRPSTPSSEPTEPASGGAYDYDSGEDEAQPGCGEPSSGSDGGYEGGSEGGPEAGCAVPPDDENDHEPVEVDPDMIAHFIDQCTLACSFGVATDPSYTSAVAAAATCLAGQDACEAMEDACAPEIDAIEEMFEAVEDQVDLDMGYASSSDTAGTGDPRENDDSNQQTLDGATAPDNGACSGGPGGGAPFALLIAAAFALLLTRRRRLV